MRAGLYLGAVLLPFVVCFMGWLWSLGSFLSSIAEPSLRLNLHFFRFAILFSSLYLLTALPFFLSSNPTIEAIILPMHFLALVCLLYAFYFVSKSLVVAETGEAVTFNDYAISLLLFLCSFIGIWLIQPRINRLYAHRGT